MENLRPDMKMDLYQQVVDHCSMPVAAEVRSLADGTPQGSDALADILWDRGLADGCLASILGYFANRIGPGTEPAFVTVYFTTAGDLAHANPPAVREAIAAAATRVPFGQMPEAGVPVFGALRANRIDIRPALAETFVSDWSFVRPQAPTWQYHLYLADLGTPGAVAALAEKIAATTNGNDATNLLKSLATVRNDEVRVVLETYRDDRRHSDAPDGAGLTIAETVGFLLRN